MNRNQFLFQSLKTWMEIGFNEIIIVDWNSKIPVLDDPGFNEFLTSNCNIKIIRSENHRRAEYFNDGWARNSGARFSKSDFLFFLDSDVKIIDFQLLCQTTPLNPEICYRGNIPGAYGSCLVERNKFVGVNGYNERMWSWGGEDLDLYIRLKTEENCEIEMYFPDSCLEHIHHDDKSRVENRFQEWEDLKFGAEVQRLEQPKWSIDDCQQSIDVVVYCSETQQTSAQWI